MGLKNNLFWEKYRPKSYKQLILLPRIKDFIKNGIETNLIFYGTSGCGKTTTSRLLTKEFNTIEINTSLSTSIETLREEITDHCNTLNFGYSKDTLKIVFLDEFDRASKEYQDGLKGFIEKYHENVRFILTTNHIDKIEPELQSRFNKVCFDPINKEETEFLENGYVLYLKAISKLENIEISDNDLKRIVLKTFPDLRSATQILQEVKISGKVNTINTSNGGNYYLEFYDFILDGSNDLNKNYQYITENFVENPEFGFKILGRSFFKYLLEYKPDVIQKNGHKILNTSKTYNFELETTIDPVLHLISYVSDLKELVK